MNLVNIFKNKMHDKNSFPLKLNSDHIGIEY